MCVTQELFYPLRVSNYGDCDQKVSGFRKQRETTRAVGGVPCSKGRYLLGRPDITALVD